jgi:hypothetical protein
MKNFLSNAYAAAIDSTKQKKEYEECLNENWIIIANNTDNLIKLVVYIVDNKYKEFRINFNDTNETTNEMQIKYSLFNTSYFNQMRKMFYKYIIPVGDNFAILFNDDLDKR